MSIEVEAIDFAGFAVGVTGEDLDGDGDEGWALKTCRNRERPVGFNFFFSFLLMIINYRRSSRSRGNMCGGKDVEGESQSQGTRLDATFVFGGATVAPRRPLFILEKLKSRWW